MYDLKSRPGIRRKRVSEQAVRLKTSESSPSNKDDHSNEESENEISNEGTRNYAKIYPHLPKEDLSDRNEEFKLETRAADEKHRKLEGSRKGYLFFSGITKYIIFIIAIVMILISGYFSITYSTNNLNCETPICLFQDHFKHLHAVFVNQEKLSWKVIGSAVISVVNKTVHRQPAVILLIADKNGKMASSCIANSLASSVEMSYGNLADHPKIQNSQHINSDKMKEVIYRTFEDSFEKQNHHAIVLENLDSFTADAAMTLHLFCDHENAPYKNIVIILTAVLDENFPEEKKFTLREMHTIAANHLNKMWESELWEEKRAALIARITGSVAVIRSEKNMPSTCYN